LIINKKGETLIESLVSLIVFSIMLPSVALVIGISFNQTSASIKQADENQRINNSIVYEQNFDASASRSITFNDKDIPPEIDVTVPVKVLTDDPFTAFIPEE